MVSLSPGTTSSIKSDSAAISNTYPNLSTFCWHQILPESVAHLLTTRSLSPSNHRKTVRIELNNATVKSRRIES